MATERLLKEIASGDVPNVDIGGFVWRPVESKLFSRAAEPQANAGVNAVGDGLQQPIKKNFIDPADIIDENVKATPFPLNQLEGKLFAGKGYNTIWRPRSRAKGEVHVDLEDPAGSAADILQLNLTAETTSFSKSLGNVPNRGNGVQPHILLNGLSYVQRVGAFENPANGLDDRKPNGIHFEPGLFMCVPASTNPPQPATINRMASIPHGTTINAQGLQPKEGDLQRRKPTDADFPKINILPFNKGKPAELFDGKDPNRPLFAANSFERPLNGANSSIPSDRMPIENLKDFASKGTITKAILQDPNQKLREAIKDQEIESFVTFEVTTQAPKDKSFLGGGTANIGFLNGDSSTSDTQRDTENANAFSMTCRYWIETVTTTLEIPPKNKDQFIKQIVSSNGIPGPSFIVPPTINMPDTQPIKKKVSWTQIQYSQMVMLNFNGLSWPHASVATLGDVSKIFVSLPQAAQK